MISEITAYVGGSLLLFSLVETWRYQAHLRRLHRIPLRVHVNGSRGKSSVTRLVGAVLQGPERRVVIKTTGTVPRIIDPEGREYPIFRPGRANILEQLRVVKLARRWHADTLVVECMAITPELIRVLEDRIIQSTVGIITNVREDHLDTMGPTMYDVAVHLSWSLPRNGIAFTAERRFFDVLEAEARRRQTRLVQVRPDEVTDKEMEGFSYLEHKEHVALALAVAAYAGVDREVALSRMYRIPPDPGVLRMEVLEQDGKRMIVYNALAANDPESTAMIWAMARARHPGIPSVALLVLRRDRPQRTESFVRVLGQEITADQYVIAGTPTGVVARALRRRGVPQENLHVFEQPEAVTVVDALWRLVDREALVVPMGNMVGLGSEILETLGLEGLPEA